MKKSFYPLVFWKTGVLFLLVITCYFFTRSFCDAQAGITPIEKVNWDYVKPGRIFTLMIGIDKYPNHLSGCVNDMEHLSKKIKSEIDSSRYSFKGLTQFCFRDEQASVESVKIAIDSIAKMAKPDDIFFFYFAGMFSIDSTYGPQLSFLPDIKNPYKPKNGWNDGLPIACLAQWASLIQCDRQYFVTDAGKGNEFRNSLITNLFESNVFVGSSKNQNRVIVTTNGYGVERIYDNYGPGGLFTQYIYKVKNLVEIIALAKEGASCLEKELLKEEFLEPDNQMTSKKVYSRVYQEKDFIPILAGFQNNNSRGPKPIKSPEYKTVIHSKGKNIAVIIGTNNYSDRTDWLQLQNPIGDGTAVGKILSDKYGFSVNYLTNQPKDTILKNLCNLRLTLDSSDNVIIFFAGHGYYDAQFSQGYIVTTDSRPLAKDFSRSSYISWPNITSMIDALPAKNIFLISDICFGGRFDFYSKSIAPQDYKKQLSDITATEFAERKSKHVSRIFLASGSGEVPDYTLKSTEHSPFASKLIEGLTKEKQFTTPGQLFQYMSMNATEPVLKYFGRHEAEGEFVMLEITK